MPRAVETTNAPAPIGPYSQAIKSGDFVFCSGQVGIDPARGGLAGDDVSDQARQALHNLGAVLRAAGVDYKDVVKTTIFLVDMNDFAAVNVVYSQFFEGSKPARSTVAVAALPAGGRVEIDAIAKR